MAYKYFLDLDLEAIGDMAYASDDNLDVCKEKVVTLLLERTLP